MPLLGDFAKLKKLTRSVEALAKTGGRPQQAIARAVIKEVRAGPLKAQYQSGVGPDGPWQPRKDGKPALVSRKLPRVIRASPKGDGAEFVWRSTIMLAHHEGHVFASRTGGGHSVFFDENGRAIKLGKLTRRAFRYSFVREVKVGAHLVGARVLPPRRQYPRPGSIPLSWSKPIANGMRIGMTRWYLGATE